MSKALFCFSITILFYLAHSSFVTAQSDAAEVVTAETLIECGATIDVLNKKLTGYISSWI